MKNGALLLTAAALGATFGFGCAPPPEPAKPAPVVVQAPPPPATTVTKLVGLPMTGAQLDVLGDIEFDTNQSTIKDTPQTKVVLQTLLTAGKAYPQVNKLRVEGHTDSDGSEAANQVLSEKRAQAVVNWLVERGIDRARFNAVGCGSRDPIVPNTTPENKQKNRRTEFDIEEVDGHPIEGATAPCAPNPLRKH